jgi:mannose-6-phosphate isomerase-like protein (cupin superfamily)
MAEAYVLQNNPAHIPVPGNKTIIEHFGGATTGDRHFSLAHMVAPPGWAEPHQTPEFDEITLMIRGKKLVEINGERIELEAGQSILIKKGNRVRYSNPFSENAEYVSLCMPAFSPDTVKREQE